MRSRFVLSLLLAIALTPSVTAQTGSVRLESEPGASVHWEGVDLGTTDAGGVMRIQGIPLGRFEVELSKPGFESTTALLHVGEGENIMPIPLRAAGTEARPDSTASPETAPSPVGSPPIQSELRAAPEPVSRDVAADEAGAPTADGTSSMVWVAVALAALASALLLRRRRAATPDEMPAVASGVAPPRPAYAPERSEPENSAPGFLEDLKKRERDLEGAVGVGEADDGPAELIELDIVDVTPLDDDP